MEQSNYMIYIEAIACQSNKNKLLLATSGGFAVGIFDAKTDTNDTGQVHPQHCQKQVIAVRSG